MLRTALALIPAVALLLAAPLPAQEPPLTVDTEMLRWNDGIPGFGGFFYDDAGLPTVYLLDPSQDGAARETFGAEVQVLPGTWEFRQLAEWKSRLLPLLSLPGAVLLDIDESLNRLRVSLHATAEDRKVNRERVELELAFSGVPRKAVIVDETEPVLPAQSLTDRFEPVPGGVHIAWGGSFCTLGYNVFRQATGDFGFITNSHCSQIQGRTEGTVYHQPADPNPVAVEVHDPAYRASPWCPPGRYCRYSDALFARYHDPSLGAFPLVARTAGRGVQTGSSDTVSSPFQVVTLIPFPLQGWEVNKIGRSTGWTYGRITQTCADINSAPGITLLCQHTVHAGARPGDSGSPVFRVRGSRFPAVHAAGLLWGYTTNYLYFSPIHNIESELGKLTFY